MGGKIAQKFKKKTTNTVFSVVIYESYGTN